MLDHLGVYVVSGLLGDVEGEGGCLFVDDVFVLADQFEDADELGEGEALETAFLDAVFDVEASDSSWIRRSRPAARTPSPRRTDFVFMINYGITTLRAIVISMR